MTSLPPSTASASALSKSMSAARRELRNRDTSGCGERRSHLAPEFASHGLFRPAKGSWAAPISEPPRRFTEIRPCHLSNEFGALHSLGCRLHRTRGRRIIPQYDSLSEAGPMGDDIELSEFEADDYVVLREIVGLQDTTMTAALACKLICQKCEFPIESPGEMCDKVYDSKAVNVDFAGHLVSYKDAMKYIPEYMFPVADMSELASCLLIAMHRREHALAAYGVIDAISNSKLPNQEETGG